ncbi:hypothetical protein AB0333_16865 [Citricoccus sp. NPDC079358]|jgi:hypothetical protein|uniref:hypothetical protein n=1 Tax=Citricoccus sp. NPDC079358 TaxID=3154653 RepID=UPI00344CA510
MKAMIRSPERQCRIAALGAVLLFSTAAAGGCASTEGETCDGGSSPSTVDEAVRGLIEAAETSDPDLACKVVSNAADDNEMVEALAELRERLDGLEVDATTADVIEGDQGGSLIPVEIHQPGSSATPIELGVLSIREEGYRVLFP